MHVLVPEGIYENLGSRHLAGEITRMEVSQSECSYVIVTFGPAIPGTCGPAVFCSIAFQSPSTVGYPFGVRILSPPFYVLKFFHLLSGNHVNHVA